MAFNYRRTYRGKIQALIFDWAGTTIDFGNMAPATTFVEIFKRRGVQVAIEEVRLSGNPWREWIQKISQLESVSKSWQAKHGAPCSEEDIDEMFADFVPTLCKRLASHAELIPGARAVMDECKTRGYKIGSLTGYLPEMLAVIKKEAAKQGYVPQTFVCPTDVPAGRPYPYMCLQNMINLQVWPVEACVKVDDIVPGIEEGLNAGTWTVGVAVSGNQVGLPLNEWLALPEDKQSKLREKAYSRLHAGGAHYVIDSVADLMPCLDDIEARLARGEKP